VPKAVALFSQFLTLADYADLRKRPAGGTDGLIEVFQAVATPSGVLASDYCPYKIFRTEYSVEFHPPLEVIA
jgi:hypothetical protein